VDPITDGIDGEFEIYGIVPSPEIIGETVEYVNNVIEKDIKVRMGYQIKFAPYKTNATTGNNTETIMAKLLALMRKKHIHISGGDGGNIFPRWKDNTHFPFTNLDGELFGREVFIESFAVTDAWEVGEETIELTVKEKNTR